MIRFVITMFIVTMASLVGMIATTDDEYWIEADKIFTDRYYVNDEGDYIERNPLFKNRWDVYKDDVREGYLEESPVFEDRYYYYEE